MKKNNRFNQKELRLADVLETVTDIFFALDKEFNVLYINHEAEKVFKLKRKEIIGKQIWSITPPDFKSFYKPFLNARINKTKLKLNRYIKSKNLWFGARIYPLENMLFICLRDITKRKNIEDRLRVTRSTFESVIQAIPDPILIINNDYTVKAINKAAKKYLPAKDISIARKCFEVSHLRKGPCRGAEHPCPLEKIRKDKKPVTMIHKHFSSQGQVIYTEITASPLTDKDGNLEGIMELNRDITEKISAEQKIKKSERRLRNITDSLGEGVYVLDKNDRLTFMNPSAERLLGYSEKELLGKKTHQKFHFLKPSGKHLKKNECNIHRSSQLTKTFLSDNDIFVRKDGSTFPVEYIAAPVKSDGQTVAVVTAFRDISERKEAETILKQSEQRFRTVVESAIDAIITIDNNGKVVSWNRSAEKILGYNKDEILGKLITKIMPERLIPYHEKGIGEVVITGKSKSIGKVIECTAKRKDGLEIPVELSLTSWRIGEENYYTGILRDISERKESEEKLKKAYETEHNISVTLQKSLLPTDLPFIKELDFKYYYQSASYSAEVGGDFFDIFRTGDGKYGVTMGDVEGKGVEAATETARVKFIVRDKAYSGIEPHEVICKVNNSLVKQRTLPFTALTYLLYDPKTSIIKICNAGNPYPYFVGSDQFIKIAGVPVSVFENQKYEQIQIKLKKNDTFILFTDGLIEPRHNHTFFGEQRVRQFIKKNPNLKANRLLKSLVDEVRKFSLNNLTDDVLVLSLRKRA